MTNIGPPNSVPPGTASDIRTDGWIARATPGPLRPYLYLMRLDRPYGAWLLLLPCWWSVGLAANGTWPDVTVLGLFALGAFIMRGAGCVMNDIVDRDLDAQVARTANRPIPSGRVSVRQAVLFLAFLGVLGLGILVQFNTFAIGVGVASLVTVIVYPYMKRYTYWPQAFLGLSFNWGALLGWAAVQGSLGAAPGALYVAGILWTLGYDTIYAHQDKEDDILAGIKSTALRLGAATRDWLVFFYGGALVMIGFSGWLAGLGWSFYPALVPAAAHVSWQILTLDINDPRNCLTRFKANRDFGLLVFAAVIVGQLTA